MVKDVSLAQLFQTWVYFKNKINILINKILGENAYTIWGVQKTFLSNT